MFRTIEGCPRLTGLKVKAHIRANDPANNDKERSDEKSDLDAGANGNTHSKVHLVPNSNDDSGNVFGGVSNDRNQNQTDKGPADARCLDKVVNATNEVVGADGNQDGGDDKDGDSADSAEGRLLGLLVLTAGVLVLRVEEVAVGAKLEDEVENVEEKENDGSSSRQSEDALILIPRAALVKNSIQLYQRLVGLFTADKTGNIQQRE